MTRPPILSDRIPKNIEEWMAQRPAARLVESQTTAAERTAAAMMDYATETEDTMLAREAADAAELAMYRALGTYEQVKATCDDHARMVRERETEAWVSVPPVPR